MTSKYKYLDHGNYYDGCWIELETPGRGLLLLSVPGRWLISVDDPGTSVHRKKSFRKPLRIYGQTNDRHGFRLNLMDDRGNDYYLRAGGQWIVSQRQARTNVLLFVVGVLVGIGLSIPAWGQAFLNWYLLPNF